MPGDRPLTEDDLHAYVDDRLTTERKAAVEAYLAEHPEAAARVRSWRASSQLLRSALAWKVQEPVPVSLSVHRLAGQRLRRPSVLSPLAAGIVLGLMVGGAGGWFAHSRRIEGGAIAVVGQEAAITHRMVSKGRDVMQFITTDRARLARMTEMSLGRALTPPDLTASGYNFIGGEPITTIYGGACMFLYEDARGERMTLFLRPMHRRDRDAPMQQVEAKDAAGYVWARDGMGYSVVSTTSPQALQQLSDQIREAMPVDGL
jgi:anti-sigma factor RsiW